MNRIIVMVICTVFLTVGRVWAQEVPPMADDAATETVTNEAMNDEAMNNEEIVNDEGYGTDDEEYYGSEDDGVNAQMNAQEENAETK